MSHLYDNNGNYLGAADTRSFGASVWEILHPGQVQAEYVAVGKQPPSTYDVMMQAVDDAVTAAVETEQSVAEGAKAGLFAAGSVVSLVAIAVVALVVWDMFPQQRQRSGIKRRARGYVKHARRRAAKVIAG